METQDLSAAHASPQREKTWVGLKSLRYPLLARRPAGQPVETRLHLRQTRREKPVTNEPSQRQPSHVTGKFTNLDHIVRDAHHGPLQEYQRQATWLPLLALNCRRDLAQRCQVG